MSVCDLDPPIAGIKRRARFLRGTTSLALAASLAFTAVSQVSAAANMMNENATATVAIPQSCDKEAGSRSVSLQFHLGAPAAETTGSVPPIRDEVPAPQPRQIVASGATIVGIASTYDPGDPTDLDAGNEETASGERYDPDDWTAAIQLDLRDRFGGVRFGRNYQPAFALVEAGDKSFIVRINDVGPLKPGRIIDLNVRAMRHIDPTMQLGLIAGVKVTPLAGRDWALGPVTGPQPVTVASREDDGPEAR